MATDIRAARRTRIAQQLATHYDMTQHQIRITAQHCKKLTDDTNLIRQAARQAGKTAGWGKTKTTILDNGTLIAWDNNPPQQWLDDHLDAVMDRMSRDGNR